MSSASRYASRKFILVATVWVAGTVFFALGMLTSAQWLTHSAWCVGLYLTGNVADTAVAPKGVS